MNLYKHPGFSIVLATNQTSFDELTPLHLVLETISYQTLLPEDIVLVTPNKFTAINELVRQFEHLSFVHQPYKHISNRSGARNSGVSRAKEEIIFFIDSDTLLLSKDCFAVVFQQLTNSFSFACGAKRYWTKPMLSLQAIKKIMHTGHDLRDDKYSILPNGINRRSGFRDLNEFSFIGNFGVVTKSLFTRVGGFDEEAFGTWGCEDVDLMLRLYVQNQEFIDLNEFVDVLHLTHEVGSVEIMARILGRQRYELREREIGYHFCVNNLFGVQELEHDMVLVPVDKKITITD